MRKTWKYGGITINPSNGHQAYNAYAFPATNRMCTCQECAVFLAGLPPRPPPKPIRERAWIAPSSLTVDVEEDDASGRCVGVSVAETRENCAVWIERGMRVLRVNERSVGEYSKGELLRIVAEGAPKHWPHITLDIES